MARRGNPLPAYDRAVEQRALGKSGVAVTRVVLGCGNFGGIGSKPSLFGQGTAREEAFRLLDAAWDLGITTLDTADAYGGGRSESYIGEWLRAKGSDVRDRVVVVTKTFNPMAEGADRGLSRARIRRQVTASLERLGLDRLPLYMAHDFDPDTPQEETLSAFDELVREGTVGAVGASNFTAEQVAEALELSALEGLTRYEWVQNAFSLLEQGDRQTMFPLCHEHGLGYAPFGPLAGGWLTGKYRRGEEPPPGSRMTLRPEGGEGYRVDATFDALEAFEREANERRVSMAALALAWLLHVPELTAIVVGPNDVGQLRPVVDALDIRLEAGDHARIGRLFS
jgi:aryl-alcohol dehydrogenase-like predicted oxidoreductase